MTPQYLQFTGLLIVISFIFFIAYSKKNTYEILLGGLLIVIFISAQLFWNDPVKGSLFHMFDSVITKVTIFCFILYTITHKLSNIELAISYLAMLFTMGYFFYLSHHHSTNEWCCDQHIFYHSLAHIFCFLSSLFAFI